MSARLSALALVALTAGCSSGPSDHVAVSIDTTHETNAGRPFYLVVRQVDERIYLIETYEDVADKVFSTPPDASICHKEVVFPGERGEPIAVKKPEGSQPVAFYFLFTAPGARWKTLVANPLPDEIRFELGPSEIATEEPGN